MLTVTVVDRCTLHGGQGDVVSCPTLRQGRRMTSLCNIWLGAACLNLLLNIQNGALRRYNRI